MTTLNTFVMDWLTAGQRDRLGRHIESNIQLAVLYSFVGIIQFLLFATFFLLAGRLFHGLALVFFALFLILSYAYLRVSGNHRRYFDMVIYMMALFCLYMVCLGGAHSSGPLWTFFVPLLASYLQGLRKGAITIIALMLMILVIFYGPWSTLGIAQYPNIFKVRFIGALIMVCLMAFTYEYSRKLAHQELVVLSEKLEQAAKTDELTGLSNRRDMKEKLRYEANRSARSQRPFCLLLADIDDFKRINDDHGHDAGDLVLQALSGRMTVSLRKQDGIARWGGEEFLILLPESGMEEGRTIAERLLKAIAGQPFRIQDKSLQLSLSIGLARFDPGSDLEKTITRADQALYRAKHKGKKRVETASDEKG
ncbi:diguanylate cyclase [Breoghania sp.]|uniref:diguanylate cyclase n=1 Tax=Breoghania sp. TaxID=2065378 RepID=UPI0029C885C2|nr:diguanylate cyclase [Breoghania sp.]